MEPKMCTQCQQVKPLSDFYRRKNKTDGHMRLCITCYNDNLQNTLHLREEQRLQAEEENQRKLQERKERTRLFEQKQAIWQQERAISQQAVERWYQQQPDRVCIACQHSLPASTFGYSELNKVGDDWIPKLHQRCQACHASMREQQALPCCLCGKKTSHFLRHLHGFHLFGGGTAVSLCCKTCEPAFLALPEGRQRLYIHSRCDLAFPAGQLIYGLFEPEPMELRYIGRTNDLERRYREHRKDRSPILQEWGPERKLYYTRSNWMDDLHRRGVAPSKKG